MALEFWRRFQHFDGAHFVRGVFDDITEDGEDWDKGLERGGYEVVCTLGDNFNAAQLQIYFAKEPHETRPEFLVTLCLGAQFTVLTATCDRINLFPLLERTVPFLKLNDHEQAESFFERALEVLFHRTEGLKCAQRVSDLEDREFEARQRARQKKPGETNA